MDTPAIEPTRHAPPYKEEIPVVTPPTPASGPVGTCNQPCADCGEGLAGYTPPLCADCDTTDADEEDAYFESLAGAQS